MVYPLQGWLTCPACGDATTRTTVSSIATVATCRNCGAKLAIPAQLGASSFRDGLAIIVGDVRVLEPGTTKPSAKPVGRIAKPRAASRKLAFLVFVVLILAVVGSAFLWATYHR